MGTSLYGCPIRRARFVALSDTDDTITPGIVTRVETEILVPSVVLAVIITIPADTAVTRPELDTVAAPLLEVHAIVLVVALAGITAHNSCAVLPTAILTLVVLIMRPAAITVVLPKEFARTLPTIDPNPVQLSYPNLVAYLPFMPDVMSW